MTVASILLEIQLQGLPDAEEGELHRLTGQLRNELLRTDVEAVEPVRAGTVPEGAKGPVDALAIAGLLVQLPPETIGATLRTVVSWFRRSQAGSIMFKVGDKELALSKATREDQNRLIELFAAQLDQ
jgi:hypothetical protein